MRYSMILASFGLVAALAGCGGGGGDSNTAASSTTGPTVTSQPPASDTASNNQQTNPAVPATPTPNVMAVTVDGGPNQNVNMLFATVTICEPGSTTKCQSIDHVLVDTGSSGLRLVASALDPTLSLPVQTAINGNTLTECMQFADGYTWGPVKRADIKLAGEKASSIPIQIIGDSTYPNIPTACDNYGNPHNTVAALAANGILGVGVFTEDCGFACSISVAPGLYYSCVPSSTCVASYATIPQQVQNPVAKFTSDNNGVVLSLGAVPPGGRGTVTGTLTFGIDTQANNSLGGATILRANSSNGYISTTYNGQTYSNSFIDSGSNGLFFHDPSINPCTSGFYCPASVQNLAASNRGLDPVQSAVSFSLENADQIFSTNPTYMAFSTLGGDFPFTSSFDWGLPFFYGRKVFTAIEGRSTPAATGPFFAY